MCRLGTIKRKLKKIASLHFVDAPYILPSPPSQKDDTSEYRTWFYREVEGGTLISPDSIEKSLAMLEHEWVTSGPFRGIIAFSMGGCVATVIASLPERYTPCGVMQSDITNIEICNSITNNSIFLGFLDYDL